MFFFFFSSRRRHTRFDCDWSSDVCSSDLEPRYRLLETTRAYVLEKLADTGERDEIARRHAEYYRQLLQQAAVESIRRPAAEWLAAYGPDVDNVRAALDWAFSPGGDSSVGVALTVASVPLWLHAHRAKHH